ncbi:MAG: hypothetical protein COA61_007790 [Zetaproteobacteria bacterium]|nr:hypothetical protein [Zetaproteobacteria bacterium]
MNQDWDIDDILASLDELLQEGNDEATSGKAKPEPVQAVVKSSLKISHPKDTLKVPAPVRQEKVTNIPSKVMTSPQKNIVKTTLQPPRHLDIDVPDANFRQEPSVDSQGDASILPRVMLTQDMMVEKQEQVSDAFSPLLEAMDDDDVEPEKTSKPVAQKNNQQMQGVHLNAKQLEQVLELVSMDVSYQFNQLLPDMIRTSLQTHLQMLQNEPLEK